MPSHTMELPRQIVVGDKNIDDLGNFLNSLKKTKKVSMISGGHVKKIVQKKIEASLSASKIKRTWHLAKTNDQKTIEDILYIKTKKAFEDFKKINSKKKCNFVVAGGVAANEGIRKKLVKVSNENNFEPVIPDLKLCGDNAAMIAMVGLEKYKIKQFDSLDLPASPRLPLDKSAKFLKGAGVKL